MEEGSNREIAVQPARVANGVVETVGCDENVSGEREEGESPD